MVLVKDQVEAIWNDLCVDKNSDAMDQGGRRNEDIGLRERR